MALWSAVLIGWFLPLAAQMSSFDKSEFDKTRSQALELFNAGEIGRAIGPLEECLTKDPDDIGILKTLGFIRYKSEDISESREYFERVLNIEGPTPYIFFMLANVAFREFRLGDASDLYRETALLDPRYPSLQKNQALLGEQIKRVRLLKGLRERCDRFYWGAIIGAMMLLLLFLAIDLKQRK